MTDLNAAETDTVDEILTDRFNLTADDYTTSPADEFRKSERGCGFGRDANGDPIWLDGRMIAQMLDEAFAAGRDSV